MLCLVPAANAQSSGIQGRSQSQKASSQKVQEGKTSFQPILHEVKKGETLWSISQEYSRSVGEIMNANQMTTEQVRQGMKIKIPQGTQEAVTSVKTEPKVQHQIYRVKQKDTFYGIAKQHGITSKQLGDANPKAIPTKLQIGQELIIPEVTPQKKVAQTSTEKRSETASSEVSHPIHRVKNGETFYSIAKEYKISIQDLTQANPSLKPEKLRVGMEVVIPKQQQAPSSPVAQEEVKPAVITPTPKYVGRPSSNQTHTVQKGETLLSLTRKYDVSLDELKIANRLTSRDVLKEGDVVLIPGKEAKSESSTVNREVKPGTTTAKLR